MTKTHLIAASCLGVLLLSSSAVFAIDDYPYKLCDPPEQGDPWAFITRNCTSYVAWRMNRDAGFTTPPTLETVLATPSASCYFHNNMMGGVPGNRWGNAEHWDDRATVLGFIVDNVPEVGAIAHWNANEGGAGSGGHVAYVELVNTDGSVNISEYNWVNALAYHTRSNVYPGRFIHLRKFIANDRAQATDPSTSVRSTPGGSVLVATKQTGDTGTVIGGPTGAFSAGNGNYYKWYKVHWDDAIEGWSIEEKLAVSTSETTPPTINAFAVTPSSVPLGSYFTISYTVSDSGGSGLNRVELWRANIDGTINDSSWTQIGSSISLSGDGPSSGNFPTDTPSAAGNYWYGIHVFDNANNYMDERIAGCGPLQRTVTTPSNISVTVQPNPSGRSFTVDGTAYTTSQNFSWVSGSSHTIATTSPQSGGTGIQYVWSSWSDSGAISHTVAPTSNITYTANFTTQYYLTMNAGTGGGVSPSSGWYNSGTVVPISATANNGYSFSSWTGTGSGSYSGSSSSSSVTMNAPITETANYVSDPEPSGWYSPTATGKSDKEWTNPTYAYSSDDNYATATGTYLDQDYYNFNFGLPSGAIPTGIQVKIEGHGYLDGEGSYRDSRILVYIWSASSNSWGRQAGAGWWAFALNGDETLTKPDGTEDLWGTSGLSDFDNENFKLKITTFSNQYLTHIDHIQAKVYYTIAEGDLEVTLGPSEAVSAGAQWNVDGGGWQNSGATVTGLSVGSHTVNYNSVTGWNAPTSESVTINNGLTTSISRNYTQVSYILTVNSSGTSAVSISSSSDHGGSTNYTMAVADGTSVNLQAPQYVGSGASRMCFTGWTGSVTNSNQSITFIMDGAKTVTTNYMSDPEPVLRSPMTVDLNHDGIPNFYDFSYFAMFWQNASCSEPNWCEGSDFDKNGIVDIHDLQIFAEFWLWPVADVDMDGAVDFTDYALFTNKWFELDCNESNNWCEGTDFDQSGSVDILDLATFAEYWLEGL